MAELTISQVAREVGLRPSAVRYYEEIGLLPPARRVSGQRRFDRGTVRRLAVVRRAQEAGFSLDEIRLLVLGAGRSSPLSARWKKAADGKIAELDARIARIRSMRELLARLRGGCRCETVEECGARILREHPGCE
jgi:MerR family transcriptional regulator, redox-sensitive transcriptional activator SoxR